MHYVRAYPGAVDDALIADLIALPGAVKIDQDEGYRRCSGKPVVGDAFERFRGVVRECFVDYCKMAPVNLRTCTRFETPNVLRYEPSTDSPEHYSEHSDAAGVTTATRQVSVIAYLNEVAQGGETVFTLFDHAQRCEKGTVLLFPSSWLYHHLARAPESGPKIVVVTWIHFANGGVPVLPTTPLG